MAEVVLVWEMGADMGHLTRLDTLAKRLVERGHGVTCIFCDLTGLQRLYPPQQTPPYHLLQGPSWPNQYAKLSRPPANLAEVLLAVGFHKPQVIAAKLAQWRAIFAHLKPGLIIYDYAPTALLATRDLACPKIGLDDPFSKPPARVPLPAYDRDANLSDANLTLSETKLINTLNPVLAEFQLQPIAQVYDLFATDESLLLSIPELDPFAHLRECANYLGPITAPNNTDKQPLDWDPHSSAKKVFAYLKPSYPKLKEFLACITQLDIQGRFFIPGAGAAIQRETIQPLKHNSPIQISEQPYDLAKNLHQCDLVICHGGHSTLVQTALCGVPALVIPLQQEQLSSAQKSVASGLALGLGHGVSDPVTIQAAAKTLLDDADFRQRTVQCAQHYQKVFTRPALDIIVETVESRL